MTEPPTSLRGYAALELAFAAIRGISSQVRPSRMRPAFFLFTPPHYLKKNGTLAARHWSRRSLPAASAFPSLIGLWWLVPSALLDLGYFPTSPAQWD
jgi:hypothetical protein